MKIKKIVIDNFRAFKHEVFELDDFNCIIGQNDSGKSTIFAAVEWFISNGKELDYYDLNTNIQDDKTEISVEIYFSEAIPLLPRYLAKEFVDEDGLICVKKAVANRQFEDRDFVKPLPYYALRVFKIEGRKELLSFCTLEDLMKECVSIGIQKEFFTERLFEYQNCTDYKQICFRSKYGTLIPIMQEALFDYYFEHDYHIVEEFKLFSESKWFKWQDECLNMFMPSFVLYTPQTPINNYLNNLFNNCFSIFEDKLTEEISNKISDSIGDHIFIEKITSFYDSNYFPTNYMTPIITGNNLELIPLQNRGDGFQQKVKNAIFKLFAEKVNPKSGIIAFEEPETHLHPSAQIEMYKNIKQLSENSKYQILITTHSPYIVKELAKDKITPIIISRDTHKQESHISNLSEGVLPYVSMNEINYIAFDEPSIEYHIELFGYMQNKLDKNVRELDEWLKTNGCNALYDWYNTKTLELMPVQMTLPYCVRNNIDHPLDDDLNDARKHAAFVNNNTFTDIQLIKASIEIMIDAISHHPNDFR